MKSLLEVCSVKTGKRDANHGDLGGPYPFFTCAEKPIQSPTFSFDGDAIILPGNGANVGLVVFFSGKFEAYQRTYVLSEFTCDPRYAYHHLRCFWLRANSSSQFGSATNYIRMGNFRDYRLPIPPLAEQRRIAEVLDRAEALQAKRRAALAQLDSFTQSLFLDLFCDPITNPKAWPVSTLGEVARGNPNNGIFRKNDEYLATDTNGLPVVWVEELFRGNAIDTSNSRRLIPTARDVERYGLNRGDILFVRSSLKLDGIAFNNVYLGEDREALFECHLIRISPNLALVDPIFLNSLFRLPQMRAVAKSKSKTATMTTIDQKSLCSIEFPLPPLELQHEFTRRVKSVEKLKRAHRASLSELDALFTGLQQRAFRGGL